MKILDIQNGIATLQWRIGEDPALIEADEYMRVGDEVSGIGAVYNGGDRSYGELWMRFIGEQN